MICNQVSGGRVWLIGKMENFIPRRVFLRLNFQFLFYRAKEVNDVAFEGALTCTVIRCEVGELG